MLQAFKLARHSVPLSRDVPECDVTNSDMPSNSLDDPAIAQGVPEYDRTNSINKKSQLEEESDKKREQGEI